MIERHGRVRQVQWPKQAMPWFMAAFADLRDAHDSARETLEVSLHGRPSVPGAIAPTTGSAHDA